MFRKLVTTALSLGGITFEEANDAAETALKEVWEKWQKLDTPHAWAYKATVSNVLKIKRKQANNARALQRQVYRGDFQPEAFNDPGLTQLEYRQWVMSLLDSLPEAQRDAVALCLVDGFSPAEAAELLGKSGAALRQALHAGREALIRQLAAEPTTGAGPETDASTIAGREEAIAPLLVDGFSSAQAAELLGKSKAARRQALHAGREALIRQLAAEPTTGGGPETDASTIPAPTAGRNEVR
jgi:DNA-directed RNA polymerase specialized sigma24 family protein